MAALASAALFAIAFPPFPFVFPAFVCLVPLAVCVGRMVEGGGTAGSAMRTGLWFGFLGYACNLYWIAIALLLFTKLAILGYVATLVWLSPMIALAAGALYAARRITKWPMAALVPVVWTASEFMLNYLSDLSFPWLPLGLTQTAHPVLVQIADLSGVRGVTFWIALTNGLLADAVLLRASRSAVVRRLGAALVAALAVVGYGRWRMATTRLEPVASIGVIQPNIPETVKLDREIDPSPILMRMTRQVTEAGAPQLVVWPETALNGFLDTPMLNGVALEHPEWNDSLRVLGAASRVPVLFGVLDIRQRANDRYELFNAAMLADSSGVVGGQPTYHKEFLVPIVERVPFLNPEWFNLPYFGAFGRGRNQLPFTLPFGKVGVLICYESIYPQLSRFYRKNGARLIVNITNDAWFGTSSAPHQHHAHLVLRAIENRVGIVRSANTGISSYIDPLGVVHDETKLFEPAVRTYAAASTAVLTLYDRLGDWVGGISFLLTVALVIAYRVRGRSLT